VFATSVFEHLMMPWKVVIELNRILEQSGLVMLTSHQTWPLREVPWDYWRFCDQAWHALFNPSTGFEVLQAALGENILLFRTFFMSPHRISNYSPLFVVPQSFSGKLGALQ
jgi:hypothetical protein